MAQTMEEIAVLLKKTKFKRQLFGGFRRDDVWKKLERLQAEYASLIETERLKNQGLVEEWQRIAAYYRKQLEGSAQTSAPRQRAGPPGSAQLKGGDVDG